jgi:hypothetical protein
MQKTLFERNLKMPYTDEQIDRLADQYANKAPQIDYSRPGVFANETLLLSFDNREARILQAYAASHGTTPNEVIHSFLSSLASEG